MSTLLDLVKDLDWPEGAVCVVQDKDGTVKWLTSMPISSEGWGVDTVSPDRDGDWWFVLDDGSIVCWEKDAVLYLHEQILTSDWNTTIITKEIWESAQTK